MKYYVITFGCEANKADSEKIEKRLRMSGHKKVPNKNDADLIVINACSVRQSAIDRIYGQINNIKNKKIILAGCVLESDKKKLRNKISEIWHPDEYFDSPAGELPVYSSKFSAYVPIMTGCNNFCTYCAVPYTRGRERSRPAKDIIKEVKNLIEKDYKEIWLLGQNVNSYKSGNINFPKLLKSINDIPGNFWIRFTSPHPKDFSDELIKTVAKCEKATKYINLPVQSGDNEILKRMNRNYTREKYIKLVNKTRKAIPNIAISTDTIVGFPGETKKQFLSSVDLYKKLKFDMAFIARYSPRSGTVSAMTMNDNIPREEKARRWKILTKTLEKTALEHNKKLVGKTLKVLVDSTKEAVEVRPPLGGRTSKCFGRTEGNKVVEITKFPKDGPREIVGKFVDVKITKAEPWKLKGTIARPRIIVVLGPTASGKSDLAVEIAKEFNGEIISADSRQVYKYMDIGTGKITKKEMGGVKHHLLDVLHPKKVFTAVDFKKQAEKAIQEILDKGKIPIVCGGTGFYIHALLSANLPEVKPDKKLRKKLESKSAEELFKILQKLDKRRAETIDPKNKRRLVRAIEIAKHDIRCRAKSTTSYVVQNVQKKSNFDVLYLGIKREDKNLKELIKNRLVRRIRQGMIAEVKKLRHPPAGGGVSWKRLDDFGLEYRYVSYYLRGKITKEEMIERLNNEINKYSKRQMTWFKKYAPETKWVKNKKEADGLLEKFLNF